MDKLTKEYIESWLKKAENDLQNVKNNFAAKEEDIPTDTVCFHCQQAESLTPFAVEIRYPDDFHAPTIEETKEVYETAKEIRDFVLVRIDIIKNDRK